MKHARRKVLSALLSCTLLAACTGGTPASTTPSTTAPSNPTTPNTPVNEYDPNRPLPVLPEKFVAYDANDENLVLSRDGVANAIIVYAAIEPKAKTAADDLADYLNRITGTTFTVADDSLPLGEGNYILVGPTQKTLELGEGVYDTFPNGEGYTIRREGNLLILCGNDSGGFTGTQFAVTRLLEEAGCGWFAPEELWQVVPSTPNLSVKTVDRDFKPRFISRTSGTDDMLSLRWYCGGYSTQVGHILGSIVPVDAYAEHPEYFALVNGSHQPDTNAYWQYCYTNPDFAVAVAEGVIARFDADPNLMTVSITANDGWEENWCQCDTCKAAGNNADVMLTFANNVAAITSQRYPERKVSILAYHSTFQPPEKVTYTHPNVEVCFLLETAPFADLSKGELIHEGYHPINHLTYTQSWKDNCLEYIDMASLENVSVWIWYCIAIGDSNWTDVVWVQGNTISNNLDLWEQMGVREVFADGEELYDVRWPLYYPLAKCMWDEGLDAESWLYDACLKLYGAAGDEMFLYYRHLADAAVQHGCTQNSILWLPPSLKEAYGEDYQAIQDALLAAVAKSDALTPAEKVRLEHQSRCWAKVYLACQ